MVVTPAALSLDAVTHRTDAATMRFDLAVPAGAWWAVIGPSGAGKSTLLDLAAGFLTPFSGRIAMAGMDVTNVHPSARPVSVVFQENNLFAHLDAFRNVALGIAPDLRLSAEDRVRVAAALHAVGLGDLHHRRPFELSGGERQRVALARAFLRNRPLLLLDEPFAALGPALRREMLALLANLKDERGARTMTIVMVTHQPEDARGFSDTVAFLQDGHIAAIGPTPDMLDRNADDRLRAYLGTT